MEQLQIRHKAKQEETVGFENRMEDDEQSRS